MGLTTTASLDSLLPLRAVFFDAGLTLIYSELPLEVRCARIANEHGMEVTPQAVISALPIAGAQMLRSYRENPNVWSSDSDLQKHWRDYYIAIFRELGVEGEVDACADAIYEEYNQPGAWQLYPDALPTLRTLHEQGYVIGVISDWATSLPAKVLLPLGVGPYVSFMVVSATMREAKPGYGLYREALVRARVPAHRAIHVGDNYINDILGARAAGIAGILLDRNKHHNGALDCPRITTLAELPALLAQQKKQDFQNTRH